MRRSLRRIVRAAEITGTAPRPPAPAARPQPERDVGLRQRRPPRRGDEHARPPRRPADDGLDQLGRRRIEVRARLVEQQQRGLVQVGARDGEPLDEALGEVAYRLVGAVFDVHVGEDRVDAGVRHVVQVRVVAQVLAAGQLPVEQRLVAHVAHLGGRFQRSSGSAAPSTRAVAAVRTQQPGEHPQQGCLPGSVSAEHRQRLRPPPPARSPRRARPARRTAARGARARSQPRAEAYAEAVARLVGINHVALEVGDVEAALDLYDAPFRLELRGRAGRMAFIDMGDQFLALSEGRRAARTRAPALRPRGRRPRPARGRAEGSGHRGVARAAASASATRGATSVRGREYGDVQFRRRRR